MAPATKYHTQAEKKEAHRLRQKKYRESTRGALLSQAYDSHRHSRKVAKPLRLPPPPPLLLDQARFEVLDDEKGFMYYFDEDFELADSDLKFWAGFPFYEIEDDTMDHTTAEYKKETRRLELSANDLKHLSENQTVLLENEGVKSKPMRRPYVFGAHIFDGLTLLIQKRSQESMLFSCATGNGRLARQLQRAKRHRSSSPDAYTHVIPLTTGPSTFNAPLDGGIERVSADSRRTTSQSVSILPPSPLKRLRIALSSSAPSLPSLIDIEADSYCMGGGEDDWTEEPLRETFVKVPRVLQPADAALRDWMLHYRDSFLRILLWRHGRGEYEELCYHCGKGDAVYRCKECFGGALSCQACCVDKHMENPFHLIECWNQVYFQSTSLKTLGLRIQVGHPPRQTCDRPIPARHDFVILHHNGIHEVSLDYCGCRRSSDPYFAQLLRAGLFPATTDNPRTCATLCCLDRYHNLTLHGKITGWDFYRCLETQTNAKGIKPPDRYQIFLRIAREYRHMQSLKRAGAVVMTRGVYQRRRRVNWLFGVLHVPVQASTCQRIGRMLRRRKRMFFFELFFPFTYIIFPIRGLYVFFLAMDACFRLKRRAISNEIRDPALSNGWAYMVEWEPYKSYLLHIGDQQEISTCTGLAALDYANTKFSRGYSATGVGMGVCARHEFVQPTGVADLQAGERFGNMDYIFGSILRHLHPLLRKLISYDIACQWWKNLFDRLRKLPPMLRLLLVLEVFMKLFIFVVPKLHILGHTTSCQLLYSLNYTLGGAQTDGEGIERPWSMIGAVAASTRVSGPGARSDLLDDHWSFWNWSKNLGLPALLRKRLDTALHEQQVQRTAFEEFSLDQAERVPRWKTMVHEYEGDSTKPNPYEGKVDGLTEAQVRERLEAEEETQSSAGRLRIHEITPVNFVTDLLEVESEQRRIAGLAELKKAKSTTMKINLRSLRRALNKRITKLQVPEDALPEDVPLLPPSALTRLQRENGGCVDGLVDIEKTLREAQCRAALVGLRNQLLIKYRLLLYKTNHSRNQTMNTRSRSLVARNESKVLFYSKKYQAAWLALVLIADGNEKAVGWRRLCKEDIRCLEDSEELAKKHAKGQKAEARRARDERDLRAAGITPLNIHRVQHEDSDGEGEDVFAFSAPPQKRSAVKKKMPAPKGNAIQSGESKRVVSWIWTTAGMTGSDAEIEEAYAREEWRRLPESFAYEGQLWAQRAKDVPVGSIPVADAEGMIAYAVQHHNMYQHLSRRAEVIRTQPKLRRGARRARDDQEASIWVGFEAGEEGEADIDGVIERDDDLDDNGNLSDEELLLTGEIDD
ncbi:CxC2 domain-containing protein [Mycena indigotica]|uniref:CxC2 domain-containing protein n=1 Tax=Mycena indigotica TaxID=2126181 RepID=A0A8H6S2K5_9AGAR|nr:CxC2 domain-containing protein [Mycena indigotica]KAF7292055.1 CxC2 domain-containing protein [Mycena indigotica]